ncbi:MAG: MFS transporter [Kosmotoga sp.]|nr:MAG: MFS transporter [Kosmotoga sp.]
MAIKKDKQFYKFASYGFLKNLRFFEPFIILFFRQMGFSFLQIGLLFSVREVSTNLLELPTGFIADLYGRKISMVFAMISYIISFIVFFFFPQFFIYAIAMVLFGLGEALRSGTHKAMILEYLRINNKLDTRAEYYGSTRAASQMGSALNSLIAAAIVFWSGDYRAVFLAALIPYLGNLFNLATYPKELDGDINRKSKKETFKNFFLIFKDKYSLKGIFNSTVFDAFFKTISVYLQPVLQGLALSLPLLLDFENEKRTAVIIGVAYFFIYLTTSYASKNADKVSKRVGKIETAINVTFLLGAVLIVLSGIFQYLDIRIVTVIMFMGLYILQNLRRPLNVSYISEKISHKTMASGLSAESQLKTILMAVLAPIIGFLADSIGIAVALVLSGLIMAVLYFLVRLRINEKG